MSGLRLIASKALEALKNYGHASPEAIESIVLGLEEELSEEQKPIAWMVYTLDGQSSFITDNPASFTEKQRALPLWAGPFEREWNELDVNEVLNLIDSCITNPSSELRQELYELISNVELILQEKNP